jgi:hypothetical protein
MKKNIILPFNLKGGNKKSFKILSEEELLNKSHKNKSGLLNVIKKMIFQNKNSNSNNTSYMKASETNNYYKNLKFKK